MTVYLSNEGYQGFNVASVCRHCGQCIHGYWIGNEYSWIHPEKSIRRYERKGIEFHIGVPVPTPVGRMALLMRRMMAYLRNGEGTHRA